MLLGGIGNEAVAAAVHRADDVLEPPVVADRPPGGLDPARQRRLADEPVTPHCVEELVLGDHPVAMADEVDEDVEHLLLHRPAHACSPELVQLEIDFAVAESVENRCTPLMSPPAGRGYCRPRD